MARFKKTTFNTVGDGTSRNTTRPQRKFESKSKNMLQGLRLCGTAVGYPRPEPIRICRLFSTNLELTLSKISEGLRIADDRDSRLGLQTRSTNIKLSMITFSESLYYREIPNEIK